MAKRREANCELAENVVADITGEGNLRLLADGRIECWVTIEPIKMTLVVYAPASSLRFIDDVPNLKSLPVGALETLELVLQQMGAAD